MKKLSPFLMFNNQLEEAIKFYKAVFKKNFKLLSKPAKPGQMKSASFSILGQEFSAFNGGNHPEFKFTWGISFMIQCKDQKEVDYYWEKLSSGGGEKSQCGWVKDPFGLSWQVTPTILLKCMSDRNANKARATAEAMMKMSKIIIADIKAAHKNAK